MHSEGSSILSALSSQHNGAEKLPAQYSFHFIWRGAFRLKQPARHVLPQTSNLRCPEVFQLYGCPCKPASFLCRSILCAGAALCRALSAALSGAAGKHPRGRGKSQTDRNAGLRQEGQRLKRPFRIKRPVGSKGPPHQKKSLRIIRISF